MDLVKRIFKTKKDNHNNETMPFNSRECPIQNLPDILLEEILINLPGTFLCKSASLVSKHWRDIIQSDMFWIEKNIRDNRLDRKTISYLNENNALLPKKIYFNRVFNKNLLKNPCGNDGFMHWLQASQEPRDRTNVMNMINDYKKTLRNKTSSNILNFAIETEQTGTNNILYEADNKTPLKNFVTSHSIGRKYQVIELDEDLIGHIKPKIVLSENWTERFDCGCQYYLSVLLVDATFQIVDWFKFEEVIPQWSDAEWKKVSHVFEVTKPVKYILYYHAGKDTQFWAGNYGAKMTNSSVTITF